MMQSAVAAPSVALSGIECQTCGAVLELAQGERTATCPYCDSPSVVERPPTPDRPRPNFALGFVVAREAAVSLLKAWLGSRGIFTHSGLKRAAIEHTRGVYLPAYLYGATARTGYHAQIGENYTVTETYTTTDSEGRSVTNTRTRTETEWRPLSGAHACYVRDVVVTASRAIANQELAAIEPFDLRALKRYSGAMIAGWLAEEPSLSPDQCLGLARDEAHGEIAQRLNHFMPGDTHRDLRIDMRLYQENLELVLLPIWVFALRYDPQKPPLRILINGQSGKVNGPAPLSTLKIVLAILAAASIAAFIYWLRYWYL